MTCCYMNMRMIMSMILVTSWHFIQMIHVHVLVDTKDRERLDRSDIMINIINKVHTIVVMRQQTACYSEKIRYLGPR